MEPYFWGLEREKGCPSFPGIKEVCRIPINKGMITTHCDLLHISITKGSVGCRVGLQPLSLTTRSWLRLEAEPSWRALQQRAAAGRAWSASALPSVLGRPQGLPASNTGHPEKTETKGESMWKYDTGEDQETASEL